MRDVHPSRLQPQVPADLRGLDRAPGSRLGAPVDILVRFVPSGEYAWLGRGGISWPEHIIVFSLREVLGSIVAPRGGFPSSRLPE